ncbi:Ig-like domain-containing protein [Actinoplanes subtropicus]|uniref:Ig-like domain-containing protein n=1 Tax=Actinoplanes subtropicus TaxID=543632 RepID=UPI000AD92778|nr:Ig-like domain-containing protein [Actinoplanes subtropicus]
MGVRRAVAALAVVLAVLLTGTVLVAGRAEASITTPFGIRFQTNTNGAILLRGNSNLTCVTALANCTSARNGTAVGANLNNNTYAMAYTDADGNPATFNDSTATITMPVGSTVLFAGLYWGADSASALRNQVKFSTDGGATYAPVTASTLFPNGSIYQGFADVTAQVAAVGNGVYGVANIQASTAAGSYAGWALVIAYHNSADDMRALRVYDGFGQVSGGNTNIPVTGFETPHAGAVHAKIGAVTYEGDRGTTGDSLEVDGQPLSDGQNPSNNFFNSTVSDSATAVGGRNPGYSNLLGFDVDQVDASGMFGNNVTSTTLTLTTSGDQYYPGVLTFTIDLYAPKITTTLTGTDLNGGDLLPGDILEYKIAVSNDGSDTADAVRLDDAIPPWTSYVPGSLTVQGTPVTDAGDGDAGSYGSGAASWTLGSIPYLGTTWVTLRVVVQTGVPVGYAITNLVNVGYTGRTTGVSVAAAGGTSATTVLQPHDDLAAGLTVAPSFVSRSATPVAVSYTATVTNASGDLEPAAVATLTLPTGVSADTMPPDCSVAGQVVTCALGPLVAGSSASAVVPATVDNTAAASAVASVTASGTGSDANAANDTGSAALAVNSSPQAVDDSASTPFATPVIIDVRANDSDPDDPASSLVVSVAGGPAHGAAVVDADQTVTYTPDPDWAGTDTFTYELDDPNGGSNTATVRVTTQDAAPIAQDDMINTPTNTAVTLDVRQNDVDPNHDPLTVVGVTQPAGGGTVTFTGTGVTFTPTMGFAGTATFGYTVSDGSLTDTATVSVDVENAAPTAANDGLSVSYAAARAGVTVPVTANDTDPNHDTLTVTAVGSPGALAGGVVTYTAPAGFSGDATFSYTISDGHGGTDTAQVTVTVADAPPVAQPFTETTGYRTALTLDVLAVATDPNGDTLHVSGTTAAAHGVVTRDPGGTLTYLPDVGYSGADSFSYTIDDGNGGSDTETVAVTVDNGLAVARDDWVTGIGGTPLVINERANDDDDPNGETLDVAVDVPPGHGSAAVGGDGRITYVPAAHFLGNDTFHYTLDDGHGTPVGATVTVTVVNTAPVARDDAATTDTNTAVIVPVLANDGDPNGDLVTLSAVATGGHGTVTANNDGTITYDPDSGYLGDDFFVYSIRDPAGLTDTAMVTVTVRNGAPVAHDDHFAARPGVPVALPVLANDHDPNTGQTIKIDSVTTPAMGTLTLAGGALTYRANPFTAGPDGFDYVISDDLGATDTAHVTIAINGVPSAVDDTVAVPADTAVDIPVLANDTDPESGPLTVTSAGRPGHGATRLNPNQTVEYRPDPGFMGTDVFGYTIVDDVGNTDSAWVTVQVADAAPVARPDTAALLSDRTVLVDVLANDSDANPGQTITLDSAGPAGHGTTSITAGKVEYAPAAGYVGPDTFPYEIDDGNGGTATGTVTITVSDGIPVAVPDSVTTPYEHPAVINVLANDLDPAGSLAVTSVGAPDHGTAGFTASTVIYTPPAGFAGPATLTYTATDDAGHRTAATVEILVGVPPSVPNKLVTVVNGRNVDISLPLTGQDGRTVVPLRVGRPAHGTAVLNPDGTVTYVPDPGFAGTDSFTYEVIDANGNVALAIVRVVVPASPTPSPSPSPSPSLSSSVSPSPSLSPSLSPSPKPPAGAPPAHRNRPPTAADDSVTLVAGDTVVIRPLLNDHDPDGDPLRLVAIRPPRHGTAVMTASTITYRADAAGTDAHSTDAPGTDAPGTEAVGTNAVGNNAARTDAAESDAIGYTVDDRHGGRATASVRIHIVPVAALPTTGHNVLAVARASFLAILTGAGLWLGGRRREPAGTRLGGRRRDPAGTRLGGRRRDPAGTRLGGRHRDPAGTRLGGRHRDPAGTRLAGPSRNPTATPPARRRRRRS